MNVPFRYLFLAAFFAAAFWGLGDWPLHSFAAAAMKMGIPFPLFAATDCTLFILALSYKSAEKDPVVTTLANSTFLLMFLYACAVPFWSGLSLPHAVWSGVCAFLLLFISTAIMCDVTDRWEDSTATPARA